MRNVKLLLPILSVLYIGNADANWQYSGHYVGDGAYSDDGTRFVVSLRGGASFAMASIANKIGTLPAAYYQTVDGYLATETAVRQYCGNDQSCINDYFTPLGSGNVGDMPATDDLASFAFAAGASIGWTIPNTPQWRLELGWDHINEVEYNASPIFEGDIELTGGYTISAASGDVQSQMNTDIVSVMAYYDFFKGNVKPLKTIIPYIGFGVGYADTKTTMLLSDLYGDLSQSAELQYFGEQDSNTYLMHFNKSEKTSNTVAAIMSFGASYGITEYTFLDFSARIAYLPEVKWGLSNSDDTRSRDWFSGDNMIYANLMMGLRFEF